MVKRIKSDFLLASPSAIGGVARLVDWYNLYDAYNISTTPAEADGKAMASDWYIVGQDISDAIDEFESEEVAA
jgi:hypothetical protein